MSLSPPTHATARPRLSPREALDDPNSHATDLPGPRRPRRLAVLTAPRTARAGGFEIPDNGTEALGRGGAFVAKADDPTAIDYNPAGLAGQRGTRVLVDGHIISSSYGFKRYGAFPDNPADPATPWGGFAFPSVRDTGGPFYAPFLAVTTDFGTLDWLTVAVGVFGPSGVGNRTYPAGIDTAPAASRYDVVQPTSTHHPADAGGRREAARVARRRA